MIAEKITHSAGTLAADSTVFEGTSVPVEELHRHMREDWNLYGFLYKFPSVSREQALDEIERTVRGTVKRIVQSGLDRALEFERSDVPMKRLFDYLANGQDLKDFHWDFPSVFVEDTWDAVVTSGKILELDAYRGLANGVVHSDRARVSGAPVFMGTRLPIRIFFDFLADGQTMKDFHYHYPSADPDQLVATIGAACEALEREAKDIYPPARRL